MNNFKSLIVLLAVASASPSFAAKVDASQQIKAAYAKMDAFARKKDMEGLSKLIKQITTDDCKFISPKDKEGKIETKNRDETVATMTGIMPFIDSVLESTSRITRLTVGKTQIVAYVSSSVVMTTKPGPDKKSHKIVEISTNEDKWCLVGTSWKLKVSKTLTEKATEDGKPIN